jgi:hypothetical protein
MAPLSDVRACAHDDPAGAYPRKALFRRLVPFLEKVALQK